MLKKLALVVLAVLIVSGCGGSTGSTANNSQATQATVFIELGGGANPHLKSFSPRSSFLPQSKSVTVTVSNNGSIAPTTYYANVIGGTASVPVSVAVGATPVFEARAFDGVVPAWYLNYNVPNTSNTTSPYFSQTLNFPNLGWANEISHGKENTVLIGSGANTINIVMSSAVYSTSVDPITGGQSSTLGAVMGATQASQPSAVSVTLTGGGGGHVNFTAPATGTPTWYNIYWSSSTTGMPTPPTIPAFGGANTSQATCTNCKLGVGVNGIPTALSPAYLSGLTDGSTYSFIVTAVTGGTTTGTAGNLIATLGTGTESTTLSSQAVFSYSASPQYGIPANATVVINSATQATVSWTAVLGATGYTVYYSTTAPTYTAAPPAVATINSIAVPSANTSQAVTGLAGATYFGVTATYPPKATYVGASPLQFTPRNSANVTLPINQVGTDVSGTPVWSIWSAGVQQYFAGCSVPSTGCPTASYGTINISGLYTPPSIAPASLSGSPTGYVPVTIVATSPASFDPIALASDGYTVANATAQAPAPASAYGFANALTTLPLYGSANVIPQ